MHKDFARSKALDITVPTYLESFMTGQEFYARLPPTLLLSGTRNVRKTREPVIDSSGRHVAYGTLVTDINFSSLP